MISLQCRVQGCLKLSSAHSKILQIVVYICAKAANPATGGGGGVSLRTIFNLARLIGAFPTISGNNIYGIGKKIG